MPRDVHPAGPALSDDGAVFHPIASNKRSPGTGGAFNAGILYVDVTEEAKFDLDACVCVTAPGTGEVVGVGIGVGVGVGVGVGAAVGVGDGVGDGVGGGDGDGDEDGGVNEQFVPKQIFRIGWISMPFFDSSVA